MDIINVSSHCGSFSNILLSIIFIGLIFSASDLYAQEHEKPSLQTIDGTVRALYSSITFGEGEPPDWERFNGLFLDDAQLVVAQKDGYRRLTPAEYQKNMNSMIESGRLKSFREKEIYRKTDRFGLIVQVFSTYESDMVTSDGVSTERGINSIQLLKKNGRWLVLSILWDSATNDLEIPNQYLPPDN